MSRWVDYPSCITFIGAVYLWNSCGICQITTSTLVTNWQTSFDWFWQFWSVTLVSFMVTWSCCLTSWLVQHQYSGFMIHSRKKNLPEITCYPSHSSTFIFDEQLHPSSHHWHLLTTSLPPSQLSNHLSLFSQILLLISLSNTSAVVWVSFLSPVFVKPWQTSYNRVQHVPHLLY